MKKNKNTYIHRINKCFAVMIVFVMVLSVSVIETHAAASVRILIDNHTVQFNEDMGFPFIDENDRTQVPLRVTLETFGAVVTWDHDKYMVQAEYQGTIIHIPINEKYIIVNGDIVENDSMAVIVNDRSYCPIRIVLESFGASVKWYGEVNTVSVDSNPDGVTYGTPIKEDAEVEDVEINDIEIDDADIRTITQLTILANFTDRELITTEEEWHEFWYNEENSVKRYYSDMSNGSVLIQGADETYGMEDNGIIVVDLDIKHPDLEGGDLSGFDSTSFYQHILDEIVGYIDLKQYDLNNDFHIDSDELAVVVIAAGHENSPYMPAGEKAVYGVAYTGGPINEADGVGLTDYALSGELYAQDYNKAPMATIGVVTHEFGHLLGLPDLYDTDYSSVGLDYHALMAAGSHTYNSIAGLDFGEYPSPMIAWSRIEAGLMEPTVIAEDGTYSVFSEVGEYNILKVPTANPDVYYLIENRQFNGYARAFNFYMDYPGIMIWRVNEAIIRSNYEANAVNNAEGARGIELIEAGGTSDLYQPGLDYWYTRYNHYFSKSWHSTYESNFGISFKVIDNIGTEMRIEIDFK